jgi:hypothetical protein
MKFGKLIYVVLAGDSDDDTDGTYLTAFPDQAEAIEMAGHGGKVAVYELDRVLTAQITHSLK